MVAPQPTCIVMSDDGPGRESTWLMPTCASVGHVHGHAIATLVAQRAVQALEHASRALRRRRHAAAPDSRVLPLLPPRHRRDEPCLPPPLRTTTGSPRPRTPWTARCPCSRYVAGRRTRDRCLATLSAPWRA